MMEAQLLTWGRRVKARSRNAGPGGPPPLWVFTDPLRLADPSSAIRLLPRGLGGVVLRPGPGALPDGGRLIARLCRERRLTLSVAGDWRLAARLHAGMHLRGGRLPWAAPRWLSRVSGSAHGPAEIRRCRRAGVAVVFISPVFGTASHPGQGGLGAARWSGWARLAAPVPTGALGGIDGRTVGALPRCCRALGAIGAFRADRAGPQAPRDDVANRPQCFAIAM